MKKTRFLSAILLVLTNSLFGTSSDTTLKHKNPTIIQMQYAGNMGIASIGIGKSFFSERLSIFLIYGYLPESVNGVEVHTFALKSYFTAIRKSLGPKSKIEAYIGSSIIRGITDNTYVKYPTYYPNGYYQQNAYHIALFTGAKHTALIKKNKWFDKVSLFAEVGTIDYEIWYHLKTDYVDFSDLWNLSFGITLNILNSKK